MRANGIRATSSTGGTGTLTMTDVSSGIFAQSPGFTDAFGTGSTAILVEYTIAEFTDSTFATIKQFEQGVGFLVPSTNVLTRTKIISTWVYGTGYAPTPAGTAPSAVNFGTNAANIRIFCDPQAGSFLPAISFPQTTNSVSGADNIGMPAANMGGAYLGMQSGTPTANYIWHFPFLWDRLCLVSSASVYITGAASGVARFGLYEDDGTGWAGNRVVDFAANAGGSEFNTSATGIKTSTLTTPILLKPQWYIGALITNAGASFGTAPVFMRSHWGTAGGAPIGYAWGSKTYAALGATGYTASNFVTSGNGPPLVMLQ